MLILAAVLFCLALICALVGFAAGVVAAKALFFVCTVALVTTLLVAVYRGIEL